jgi:hypothetical protein
MAENTIRIDPKSGPAGSPGGVFSRLEQKAGIESLFEEGFPVRHLPKVIFVMALSILYIGNTHSAEKTVRRIHMVQSEVDDLRADYTTLKSDLMFSAKQSEVARRVKAQGLTESLAPPFKIVVDEDEY